MWIAGTATVTGAAEPEQVPAVATMGGVLQALAVPPLLGRWLEASDEDPNGPARDPADLRLLATAVRRRRERRGAQPHRERRVRGDRRRDAQGFRVVDTRADLITPLRFRAQGWFHRRSSARASRGSSPASRSSRRTPISRGSCRLGSRGFPSERRRRQGQLPRHLENHARDSSADAGRRRQGGQRALGGDGHDRRGPADRVRERDEPVLVRSEKRRPELAVRAALGAGAWRIMRTLLIESALLGVAGGAAGFALAYGALTLIKRLAPATLPRIDAIALDSRALVFTLAVSTIAGLALGLIPALRYAGPKINAALRGGGRSGDSEQSAVSLTGRARRGASGARAGAPRELGLMIRTSLALSRSTPASREPRVPPDRADQNSSAARTGRHARHADAERDPRCDRCDPERDLGGLCERDADGGRADDTGTASASRTSRASRTRKSRCAR